LTFQQPQKGDLDRKLSELMHEMRQRLAEERVRIVSDAAARGSLQSNGVVVVEVGAADRLHKEAMERAAAFLFDFIERTGLASTETVTWARPHLENLSDSLIATVKPHGFPVDHDRLVRQYRAVFHQRLTSTLRDVEIGYGRPEVYAKTSAFITPPSEAAARPEIVVTVEKSLHEHPKDIGDAARALSNAIADQIDQLNSSKPNDPDALARQYDFIGFLRQIADSLDDLADALDSAIATESAEKQESVLTTAAATARGLGTFINEGIKEHRTALKACAVQVPLLGACVWLMGTLGVNPSLAFTGILAIMGVKSVFPAPKDD
jgi:hypothetical protein